MLSDASIYCMTCKQREDKRNCAHDIGGSCDTGHGQLYGLFRLGVTVNSLDFSQLVFALPCVEMKWFLLGKCRQHFQASESNWRITCCHTNNFLCTVFQVVTFSVQECVLSCIKLSSNLHRFETVSSIRKCNIYTNWFKMSVINYVRKIEHCALFSPISLFFLHMLLPYIFNSNVTCKIIV